MIILIHQLLLTILYTVNKFRIKIGMCHQPDQREENRRRPPIGLQHSHKTCMYKQFCLLNRWIVFMAGLTVDMLKRGKQYTKGTIKLKINWQCNNKKLNIWVQLINKSLIMHMDSIWRIITSLHYVDLCNICALKCSDRVRK